MRCRPPDPRFPLPMSVPPVASPCRATTTRTDRSTPADYVLWRKTLGSTTNLNADGSGPTTGVPNGVVDQFDYDYWRSNFGNGFALSGAGSGAGADFAESSATSSLSEPVTTVSAASIEPVDTKVSSDRSTSGGSDNALFELILSSSPSSTSRSVATDRSLANSARTACCGNGRTLVAARSGFIRIAAIAYSFLDQDAPTNIGCDVVDHFFASLDAADLAGDRLLALL